MKLYNERDVLKSSIAGNINHGEELNFTPLIEYNSIYMCEYCAKNLRRMQGICAMRCERIAVCGFAEWENVLDCQRI